MAARKIAVVFFNLGGPDGPDAVRPFLFNLFNDPAIIRVPQPLRWLIAQIVSRRRAPVAREIYAKLGGGSPIVPETQAQARALEARFGGETSVRVFLAMRYWHPFAHEAVNAVRDWGADEIVLLPLYPQFSTTTTQSSFDDWQRAAQAAGLKVPAHPVCCYPVEDGFVRAYAALIRSAIEKLRRERGDVPFRLLLSAHGLPKRVVDGGDPYQEQVEQSAAAVVGALDAPGLDWQVCYQSRVGPLEWIGPATDAEIERAGREGKAVVLVPIAFVSEHSETLVELDIEYGELAAHAGVPAYVRVPTVSTHPAFIDALEAQVRGALASEGLLCPGEAAGSPCLHQGGH